ECPAHSLGGAELGPCQRAATLARDGAPGALFRLLEVALLALEDRNIHQWSCELRVLQCDLLESQLGLDGIARAHEAHGALKVSAGGGRNLGARCGGSGSVCSRRARGSCWRRSCA